MSDDEILEAIPKLQAVTNEQTENFVQSYSNFIDALKNFGSKKYTERSTAYPLSLQKLLSSCLDRKRYASFLACFKCQVQSLTQTIQRTANLIVENPLD